MKIYFNKAIVITITLLLSIIKYSTSIADITILTPKNESIILKRKPEITIVIKTNQYQKIHLKSEGNIVLPIGNWKIQKTNFFHFRIKLKKGENKFVINPEEHLLKIKYIPIRTLLTLNINDPDIYIFHKEYIIPPSCQRCHTKKVPKGIKINKAIYGPFDPRCISCHKNMLPQEYYIHAPAGNWLCGYCHGKEKIRLFTGKPEELCIRCHLSAQKYHDMAYVHGPVGSGDCTACHDPHAGPYRFQLEKNKKVALCILCHKDKEIYIDSTPGLNVHAVLSALGCVACHDPHATNYRYQLKDGPINKWCTTCHQQFKGLKRGHPLKSHPLLGPKDPLRKGRMLSCTSCHNPHGSIYKHLLIEDVTGGKICTKCHNY
ncbi:cytochrome c3 family protein [Thermodesulfatator autotrophicus]|uniref:Doubled CXXCH motif domain-containing protein n=1 Tax=Thermodesulfatator autotrophicus TaxID=1795632 RepID=A0A177E628_9BACT|nr:cytochrome c3 family protein [Thermodesulfatator autotrophicus]OAG26682.1 hypothetical protein TH606_11045 [Thermodesulfatator autotrophicus]